MKIRNYSLLIFLVFAFNTFAYAKNDPWSEKLRSWFSRYDMPFKDTFSSTVWGSCTAPDIPFEDLAHKALIEDIKNPYLLAGRLPFVKALKKNDDKKAEKAPLVFAITGAFNNIQDKQVRRLTEDLSKAGNHTIVFPNPWGKDFISAFPPFHTGDIVQEARVLYHSMREIYANLEEQDLVEGGVHLMGVSYGGFSSAVIAAMDAEHERPIINGHITLIASPFNLGRTLERLDYFIEESKSFTKLNLLQIYLRTRNICKATSDEDFSAKDFRNARGIAVIYGFQMELTNTVEVYDRISGEDLVPKKGFFSRKYKRWKENLNFSAYMDIHAPEVREILQTEKGHISHWIDRALTAGKKRIRIFAADDDWLNDPGVWEVYSDRAFIPEHGGHYGFRSLKWFKGFLLHAFGPDETRLF